MEVIRVDPTSSPVWERLVLERASDVFHSPAWIRVLANTYGFLPRACVLMDAAGNPQAGLPFCVLEDIKEKRVVALPFSDFCDPIVDDASQWDMLMVELIAEDCPVVLRCLHNNAPIGDERLKVVNRAKWHGLSVNGGLEEIWSSLHGAARRAINKARREHVRVRPAENREDLRAFFELHLGVRKHKYQLVAQPFEFFEQLWKEFIQRAQGQLMLAHLEDRIIGGVLFLEWKDKLYYKFNASDPDFGSSRPNDLVLWEGINYATSKGYSALDFGLSDWDQEGLLRYKRKYADEEKTISFLRYAVNSSPGRGAQELAQLLPRLTDLFTDPAVPDHVTESAGDILYRYFT